MLSYRDLLENVDERGRLGGSDQAREAVDAVLASVAAAVGPEPRRTLADAVPGALRPVVEDVPDTPAPDADGLLALVAARAGVPRERARYQAQAVLSYVAEVEPDVADQLRRALPDDADELFTASLPAPDARAAAGRPTQLSPEEVAAALRTLSGWTGSTAALERTVVLPPGQGQAQLDRVHLAERDLDHRARIEQRPDGITFRVWTHSCGCVTDLDVELARRIDEAVEGL